MTSLHWGQVITACGVRGHGCGLCKITQCVCVLPQAGRPSVGGSSLSESVLVENESSSSSQKALGAPVVPQPSPAPSGPPPATPSKVSDF